MDPLSEILGTLNMKGMFYFRTSFAGKWGVSVPEYQQAARFHLVVQGQLNVGLPSGKNVLLNPGDIILIPHGSSHILSDSPRDEAPKLETVLEDVGYDGNGLLVVGDGYDHKKTKLICGHFSFREGADHPLLRALPDHFIITPADRAENPLLEDVMRILLRQVFATNGSSIASVTRLSETMFIEILRMNLVGDESYDKIMSAFSDQKISRAISLIHSNPNKGWTVESLASEIGMSRTRFAHRFKELIQMGPMAYLFEWRLQKSLQLLESSTLNVQQIALETGYKSSAAFSRAFSGQFGCTPSEYRQRA
jgi:AraC-like DNA-binding protein